MIETTFSQLAQENGIWDLVIIGLGCSGIGVAFSLSKNEISKGKKILFVDSGLPISQRTRNGAQVKYFHKSFLKM